MEQIVKPAQGEPGSSSKPRQSAIRKNQTADHRFRPRRAFADIANPGERQKGGNGSFERQLPLRIFFSGDESRLSFVGPPQLRVVFFRSRGLSTRWLT